MSSRTGAAVPQFGFCECHEFERRGFVSKIVRSPNTYAKTPNEKRTQVMVEALKNMPGDIVLVGISIKACLCHSSPQSGRYEAS